MHHVIYVPAAFQVASYNGSGGDTITRNVADGRTHAQTDGRKTHSPLCGYAICTAVLSEQRVRLGIW